MTTVKVNIGSEANVVPGWINYDISPYIILSKHKSLRKLLYALRLISKEGYEFRFPPSVIRRDVRKGLPLPDESVDFIYCSHFLEHLTYQDAIKVLKECHRVLKQKMWIRIVCPDLRLLASKYLEGDLRFFQVSRKDELSYAFIKALSILDERSFLRKFIVPYNIHHYMYDFDSLKSLLVMCGFSRVEKRGFRRGITPDIDKLDNRPLESLYVEAQKL